LISRIATGDSSAMAMRLMSAIRPMIPSAMFQMRSAPAIEPRKTAISTATRRPGTAKRFEVMYSMFDSP
jgi:hypothetical protein